LDIVAHEIGIEPLEFRRKNALKDGRTTVTGQVLENVGFIECLDKAAKDIEWDKRANKISKTKYRGKGIAGMYKAPSMPNNVGSSAILKINEDGTVNLLVSAMDLGQGSDTVLTQIAAEVLTVPISRISIMTGDTDCTPYEWQTVASRTTYCCGNSVKKAAEDAKAQLLRLASLKFDITEEGLELKCGQVISKIYPDKKVRIADLAMGLTMPDGSGIHGPIIGRGAFIPPEVKDTDKETGQGEKPVAFWTFGVQAAEVEVDIETGEVKVLKIAAAYDAGKAINPDLIRAQIEGGIVQGLGSALLEEMKIKEGKVLNPSFVDYKIPVFGDTPEMKISIIEVPEPTGPWGARGIAEPCMVPTAPAIANAVYDAIGCRINSLPITAEKVLKAIMEKKR
jgi:CO/xanthine dehydrogenase Mo-binding subunit